MIGRKSRNSFMPGGACAEGKDYRGARLPSQLRRLNVNTRFGCLCSAARGEVDRGRVDAETLAGGRRAVVEHVAEVGAALLAAHLDAQHAVAAVGDALDAAGLDRLAEARPAAAGVELRARIEEGQAAAGAHIGGLDADLLLAAAVILFGLPLAFALVRAM